MNESKTRDKILKRIRQALMDKAPDPFPAVNFTEKIEDYDEQEFPELLFAEKFIAAGGFFTFCENQEELNSFLHRAVQQLKAETIICTHSGLKKSVSGLSFLTETGTHRPDISLSSCFCLTAFPPSLVLSSSSCFHPAKNYFIVVSAAHAVHDLKSGLNRIKEAVRMGREHSFEIVSFAENESVENTALLPARNFYIAMIDWELS